MAYGYTSVGCPIGPNREVKSPSSVLRSSCEPLRSGCSWELLGVILATIELLPRHLEPVRLSDFGEAAALRDP